MYYKLLCTSREINRIIRRRCASSDTYLKGELYDIGKTDIIVKAHMVKLQVDSTITRLDILDELLDTGKHFNVTIGDVMWSNVTYDVVESDYFTEKLHKEQYMKVTIQ